MTNAAELIHRCQSLGASVWVEDKGLQLDAPTDFPDELIGLLRENKAAVLEHLLHQPDLAEQDPSLVYPGKTGPTDTELVEIEQRVEQEGYVLLWSTELEDFIAFYMTEADRRRVPPGFVPYSDCELRELFGDGKTAPSPDALRRIHRIKKLGAHVTGSEEAYPE